MRVAIVQEQLDVRRGGAETSTVEMARHLAALGLDVTVVCSDSREASEPSAGADRGGLKFHRLSAGGSKLARTVRFVAQADRFCRREGFDIIHAVTPCFSCNIYQPRGGTYVETVERSVARAGSPVGRLIKRIGRRFNRRQRFLLLAERELLRGARPPCVAAVSEYVKRQVERAFPAFPAERLRVIFNGVSIEPLGPPAAGRERAATRKWFAVDDRTRVVLFVAHNFKLKGLAELIRALGLRRKDPWHLAVVGRGEARPFLRLASRARVAEMVKFHGPIEDVRSLYYGADVLAHPTWYDPCSRVVLEALVCGLPVVTTRFNGAAEVIEDGRHGVVIDSPRDAPALAAAIENCSQADVRAACQAAASATRERLSMVRHAQELKSLYEEVAAS